MSLEWILFFILCISPLFTLLLHMVLARLLHRRFANQVIAGLAILLGFIPVMGIMGGVLYLKNQTFNASVFVFLYTFIVYLCIGYSYFHIFNMSETARRIRILYETYSSKKLSRDELKIKYGREDMVKVRLERLVDTGQLRYMHDRYYLRGYVLYRVSRMINVWRSILGFAAEKNNRI